MSIEEILDIYKDTLDNVRPVPKGFWDDDKHVKVVVKFIVNEILCISEKDIPTVLNYKTMLKYRLRSPLKRFGHSPYKLLRMVYPRKFTPLDFNVIPHNIYSDKIKLRRICRQRIEKWCGIQPENARAELTNNIIKESGLYKVSILLTKYEFSVDELLKFVYPSIYNDKKINKLQIIKESEI